MPEKDDHIYDSYISHRFGPFVINQVETMWRPDNFERIRQVLSDDHYYRQTESNLPDRPKSRSTRQILLWLSQHSKKPNQPNISKTQRCLPSVSGSQGTPKLSNQILKENLPMSGREITAQVSGLLQGLSLHWKLKELIAKRFCKFLLRKRMLRSVNTKDDGRDSDLYFEEHRYYTWNRQSPTTTSTIPSSVTNKTPVANLDSIAMSQMHDLLRSQREIISHLKQKIRKDSSSDSDQNEHSFHSIKPTKRSFHSIKRTKNISHSVKPNHNFNGHKQLNIRLSAHNTKYQMRPSQINLTSLSISSDPEIYYDAHLSTTSKERQTGDKYSLRVCRPSHRPTTVPQTINEHKSLKPIGEPQLTDCSESGILFHIKKNLTFGQQSLVSTALGLKSYLFKGTSTSIILPESNDGTIADGEDTQDQNSKRGRGVCRTKESRPLGELKSNITLVEPEEIIITQEDCKPSEMNDDVQIVQAQVSSVSDVDFMMREVEIESSLNSSISPHAEVTEKETEKTKDSEENVICEELENPNEPKNHGECVLEQVTELKESSHGNDNIMNDKLIHDGNDDVKLENQQTAKSQTQFDTSSNEPTRYSNRRDSF